MRIAITGSSGLVGTALREDLAARGHAITRVLRDPESRGRRGTAYWNPDSGEVDEASLEDHDVVIHLAGTSLFVPWTRRRREVIRRSRVQGTQILSAALAGLSRPPSLLLCASGVGIYGDRGDAPLTEDTPAGDGFLPRLVRSWEAAAEPAEVAGIRVVPMRFGMVLSPDGGMLGTVLPLFRFGVGGTVGPGDQVWSWIALPEMQEIVAHVIATPSLQGPVNVATPNAITAREFSHTLGRVLRRPVPFHVPRAIAARVGGGMLRELAVASARAVPERLERSGYSFRYPLLEPTLRTLLARP